MTLRMSEIFAFTPNSTMNTRSKKTSMSGRTVHFVLLTAGLFLSMIGSAVGAQAPANPNSGPKTTALINWLSELDTRSGHKVLSGQFVGPNYGRPEAGLTTLQDCYDYSVGNLATATGKYVALVGFSPTNRPLAGGGSPSDNMPDYTNIKPIALSYANNGGIVTITWLTPNPFDGSHQMSAIPAGHTLIEIITPGTAANTQYMTWLSAFADGLQYFEDNAIPVIVRPFAEMNGGWFWWGAASSASNYNAVWQHCFNYLTVTRGLANLLFSWAPDSNQSLSAATSRYPGNGYVDIIGWSRYTNAYTNTNFYSTFNSATYGKVLMYAEVGKNPASGPALNDMQIMNEIKGTFPNLAGYMFWMKTPTADLTMIAGTNEGTLLADSWTINRDTVMKGGEFDDPSASITYSGTWNHVTGLPGFYLGTEAASNTTGAYAELTFMGTGIQVMVKKDTGLGKFDVYIDNMTTPVATNIDTYSPSTLFQQIVYSNLTLASGTHKIRIKLNGQKNPSSAGYWIGLDGFISQ